MILGPSAPAGSPCSLIFLGLPRFLIVTLFIFLGEGGGGEAKVGISGASPLGPCLGESTFSGSLSLLFDFISKVFSRIGEPGTSTFSVDFGGFSTGFILNGLPRFLIVTLFIFLGDFGDPGSLIFLGLPRFFLVGSMVFLGDFGEGGFAREPKVPCLVGSIVFSFNGEPTIIFLSFKVIGGKRETGEAKWGISGASPLVPCGSFRSVGSR